MKNIFFVVLFYTTFSFSQIPSGYYDSATGTGYPLRTQLHTIISNGYVDNGYTPGLWITYQTSDRDYFYENNGTILDMYSENPSGSETEFTYFSSQCGSGSSTAEGECYNREHSVPKYFFTVSGVVQNPMYSDAHFVIPTDRYVNSFRSAYPIGIVGANPTFTSLNGSKLGPALNSGYAAGYSGIVFEPIDEFKGDFARMYFYFVTRYEDVMTTWGNTYGMFYANPPGNTTQIFTNTFKNILLAWHNQDPVSPKEIARNNAIYTRQNNRNPFIDNPQYAQQIWGTTLSNQLFDKLSAISVYPNPATENKISIDSDIVLDEIDLININGQLIQQIIKPSNTNASYNVENIPYGFYFLKLTINNQSITKKIIVN